MNMKEYVYITSDEELKFDSELSYTYSINQNY